MHHAKGKREGGEGNPSEHAEIGAKAKDVFIPEWRGRTMHGVDRPPASRARALATAPEDLGVHTSV